MKLLFKYIMILTALMCISGPIFSQKKHKKRSVASHSKTASTKSVKKEKKGKKQKAKKSKANSRLDRQPKFDETANLNTLLKNTSEEVKASKLDSIPEKVVTILSAFKPQLKNVAKISFTNAIVVNDTSSIVLDYQVPSQNLSFQYRPISLVPRAFKMDSLDRLKNITSIKFGYGNYAHQFIEANVNAMDQMNNTHSLKLYNETTKGTHPLQNMQDIGFRYLGDVFLNEMNHLQTQAFYENSQRYRYGLVSDKTTYPSSNFKQQFSHYGVSLGWLNYNNEINRIKLNPTIKFEQFEDQVKANNTWLYFKNPMTYKYKQDIKLSLDISYSYNQYRNTQNLLQKNQELRFDPAIELNKLNSLIKLGVSPSFENSVYKLYPMVEFKKKLTDTNYLLLVGWNSQVINNQYTSLVMMNPWITAPSHLEFTTQEKKFVEVQVNAGKRLDYSISFSMNDYKNLPLFNRLMNTDRNINGLKYEAIFEKRATTIELDASLRYQFSDKLLVLNKFKYIQFNSLVYNAKPWGVLPLELNSSLHWVANNKWMVEAGAQYWTGATLYNESSLPYNVKNSLVLNAGFTYKLAPNWSAWVKGENLLDKPYERWGDYPSLGAQFVGGVVYSFRK
jgi:hypothetical protein